MPALTLPRAKAAAAPIFLSALALVALVPDAPASRSGSPGGAGSVNEGGAICPNVGTSFVGAQVLSTGTAICSGSSGVDFTIGHGADGSPINYSQPICPSEITYRPSHHSKVLMPGQRVVNPQDLPYLTQSFKCEVNPSFSYCATSGSPSAQTQSARSYTQESCDDTGEGLTTGGGLR